MKDIALALLIVGLCFYSYFRVKDNQGPDYIAGIIAFIASIQLLI